MKSSKGVEIGGLLKGLGWVERQLSSTHNLNLLHAYTSGRHQVKEGRRIHKIQSKLEIVLAIFMTNIYKYLNDNTEQGTCPAFPQYRKDNHTPSGIAFGVLSPASWSRHKMDYALCSSLVLSFLTSYHLTRSESQHVNNQILHREAVAVQVSPNNREESQRNHFL